MYESCDMAFTSKSPQLFFVVSLLISNCFVCKNVQKYYLNIKFNKQDTFMSNTITIFVHLSLVPVKCCVDIPYTHILFICHTIMGEGVKLGIDCYFSCAYGV